MKKTRKRKITLLVCLTVVTSFLFAFVGCGSSGNGSENSGSSSNTTSDSTSDSTSDTPPLDPVSIVLSESTVQLIVGDYKQLTVSYSEMVEGLTIEWKSEDEQVAVVNNGVVEAISEGTTTIKAIYGEAEATCEVQVSFGEATPLLKLGTTDRFCVNSGEQYTFAPKIIFNNREFLDGVFTYTSSDPTILTLEDNVLTALKAGVAQVYIQGSWRGKTVENAPALQAVVEVEVTETIEIRLQGKEETASDLITMYTLESFNGNQYKTSDSFLPLIYKNGVLMTDAQYTVINSRSDIVSFDETTCIVQALKYGESLLTIEAMISDKVYSKTFTIQVLRPETTVEKEIQYFSTYKGTLKNAETFAEETVITHILGNNDVEIVDAYQGDKQLTVQDNRIFGLNNNKSESYKTTLTIGTATVIYHVDATVYGMYITEASDLEVFVLNKEKTKVDLYIELGCDINAQNYTLPKGDFQITSKKEGEGFTGVLEGNGYAIKSLTLQNNQGLFGSITYGTIKNIAFMNWAYPENFSQSTGILGVNVEGVKTSNVYVKISQLPKVAQGASVLASYKIEGGTFKYTYLEYSQSIGDVSYDNCYSAFGAIKPGNEPTFENCLIVSQAPIGVCKTEQSNLQVAVASNISSDYLSALANNIKQNFAIANGKPVDSLTVKTVQLKGVRQYNSIKDLQMDIENTSGILSLFSTEYWTISENRLLWGKNNPGAVEQGTIYLDLGIVSGKYVAGIESLELKVDVGETVALPTNISCMGYIFKGWQYMGEMLDGGQIIAYDGRAMTVVAVWEKDPSAIQTPII
ncbi:MAG: Ig-like domain-containing protein [Clostridiales bacterium]|nr:Ig-like domain-containing protein [Clostridiales bacterium]